MPIESYIPSERDKAEGKWAVVCELLDEDGEPDLESSKHVIPIQDAPFHQISSQCWCTPKLDMKKPGDRCDIWLHNMSQ